MPIFVDTFLLKGGLNQIIILLWLRLLRVFVLTYTCVNIIVVQYNRVVASVEVVKPIVGDYDKS